MVPGPLRALYGLTISLSNLAGAAYAEWRAAHGERRTRKMASWFPAAAARAQKKAERPLRNSEPGWSCSSFHSLESYEFKN